MVLMGAGAGLAFPALMTVAMAGATPADAGLASSRTEARKLAQGGGLRLNDQAVLDGARPVTTADLGDGGVLKLAAGKKKIVLVKAV